jgi:hypothetical protein
MDSYIPVRKGRKFQGPHKKGGITVVLTYNRNSLFLGINPYPANVENRVSS